MLYIKFRESNFHFIFEKPKVDFEIYFYSNKNMKILTSNSVTCLLMLFVIFLIPDVLNLFFLLFE